MSPRWRVHHVLMIFKIQRMGVIIVKRGEEMPASFTRAVFLTAANGKAWEVEAIQRLKDLGFDDGVIIVSATKSQMTDMMDGNRRPSIVPTASCALYRQIARNPISPPAASLVLGPRLENCAVVQRRVRGWMQQWLRMVSPSCEAWMS